MLASFAHVRLFKELWVMLLSPGSLSKNIADLGAIESSLRAVQWAMPDLSDIGNCWVNSTLVSSFQGIFRKPKDCKERYTLLMEQVGGDDNDTLDDLCSSHLPMSLARKVIITTFS
jgi:hypothetical protein